MGELNLAVINERINTYINNNDKDIQDLSDQISLIHSIVESINLSLQSLTTEARLGKEARDAQISDLKQLLDQRFEAQDAYNQDCENRHSRNGTKNGKTIPLLILGSSAGSSGIITALIQLFS